jgi:uncharacterized protein (TIGR03086 family)
MMDIVKALDQTFQHGHGVIAAVRPDQLDDPTPCEGWTVRDLLGHTIGVVAGIGAGVSGQAPAGELELSADPAAQFQSVAASTLAAWRTPGILEQTVNGPAGPMPGAVLAGINLLDTATHLWDIAKATGQPTALPEAVASAALEASQQTISPEIRTGRFGTEIAAPASADTTTRLVAFLGRQP